MKTVLATQKIPFQAVDNTEQQYYFYFVTGDAIDKADPNQLEFSSFTSTFLLVGTNEIIHDDTIHFYEKIKPVQTDIQYKVYPDQGHVWPQLDIASAASQEALRDISDFINRISVQ